MRITIGIATNGRHQILKQALQYLARQSRLPDELIVCTPSADGLPLDLSSNFPFPVRHVKAELGLTKQRNGILREAQGCDVLLFIDDDFFACRTYVEETARVFESGSVAVATGTVVVDGIKGPGITPTEAEEIIRKEDAVSHPRDVHRIKQGYGCNMALRYRPMVEHCLIFDENLPRYGWYEDVDMMRRLAAYGDVVRMTAARGVHLGAKVGRTSGRFLGYSQVSNPFYLYKKGVYNLNEVVVSVIRNLGANISRSITPESYIDRRGRLYGNLAGLKDLATGSLHPLNALLMDRTAQTESKVGKSMAGMSQSNSVGPADGI